MKKLLFAFLLLAPLSTLAGSQDDDAPIPYGDDDEPRETKLAPKKGAKKLRDRVREEDEEEVERAETLAHLDDSNTGVGGEVLAGAMLFESSRGAFVDPRFMFGLRATWEWGRLIPDEYLREVFFADLTWQYAATTDGTTFVNAEAHSHYFTVAPGFALPFGKAPLAAFAQVGTGFNFTQSVLHVDTTQTTLGGTKFLFQYGIGLRGRPAIVANGSIRLTFRFEFTRFVRGYLNDTYIGGSVGLVF